MASKNQDPKGTLPADRHVTGASFSAAIARGDNRTAWQSAHAQLADAEAPHEAATEAIERVGIDPTALIMAAIIFAVQIIALALIYF